MRSKVRAVLRKNRIIACMVGIAVIFVCIIMVAQIISLRRKNAELEARRARLDSQIQTQLRRQAELNDDETYVRTQEYIEEKAKSIGYVYPDEIIFKRED